MYSSVYTVYTVYRTVARDLGQTVVSRHWSGADV